jgi:hypothetical protein
MRAGGSRTAPASPITSKSPAVLDEPPLKEGKGPSTGHSNAALGISCSSTGWNAPLPSRSTTRRASTIPTCSSSGPRATTPATDERRLQQLGHGPRRRAVSAPQSRAWADGLNKTPKAAKGSFILGGLCVWGVLAIAGVGWPLVRSHRALGGRRGAAAVRELPLPLPWQRPAPWRSPPRLRRPSRHS